MTTKEITVLPLHEALAPQRESYLNAMSAQSRLVAKSPALPYSSTITVPAFAPRSPRISLFMASAADVEAVGRYFGVDVVSRPHTDELGADVKTWAEGVFEGVPFEAWVLSASVMDA